MPKEIWNNDTTERLVTTLTFDFLEGDLAPDDYISNKHYVIFMERMQTLLNTGKVK